MGGQISQDYWVGFGPYRAPGNDNADQQYHPDAEVPQDDEENDNADQQYRPDAEVLQDDEHDARSMEALDEKLTQLAVVEAVHVWSNETHDEEEVQPAATETMPEETFDIDESKICEVQAVDDEDVYHDTDEHQDFTDPLEKRQEAICEIQLADEDEAYCNNFDVYRCLAYSIQEKEQTTNAIREIMPMDNDPYHHKGMEITERQSVCEIEPVDDHRPQIDATIPEKQQAKDVFYDCLEEFSVLDQNV